jgi:hypothetical protein
MIAQTSFYGRFLELSLSFENMEDNIYASELGRNLEHPFRDTVQGTILRMIYIMTPTGFNYHAEKSAWSVRVGHALNASVSATT